MAPRSLFVALGCASVLAGAVGKSQNPPVEVKVRYYNSNDCSEGGELDVVNTTLHLLAEGRGDEGTICGAFLNGTGNLTLLHDSEIPWASVEDGWNCDEGCCSALTADPNSAPKSADFSCIDFCEVNEDAEAEIDWASVDTAPNGKVGPGVLLEVLVLAYCFVGLGIVCDDHLCPALETLCVRWMIPEDVAGATFMALGSAAPEIVINMIAVVRSIGDKGDPEAIQLGVSAVLGSGIVSFLLSTGVCAFYAPGDLVLKRRPLLRDAGSYLIMMILLIIFFDDGVIHVMEAATLVILYFVYLPIVAFSGRIRQWWRVNMQGKQLRKKVSFVHAAAGGLDEEDDELLGADDEDEVEGGQMEMGSINNGERTQSKVTFKDGDGHSDSDGSDGGDDDDDEEDEELGPFLHFMSAPLRFCFEWTCPDAAEGAKYETWYPVTAIVSFIWIAIFSFLLSTIISRWSTLMGIPTILLGATLVAMGGEVPDTIQSIAVAKRGYGGLAVANCLGSKVANVGLGLGLSWLLSAALGQDVKVCNAYKLRDLAMFHTGAIIIFLSLTLFDAWITCKNKALLGRGKGAVLLISYPVVVGGYIAYFYLGY